MMSWNRLLIIVCGVLLSSVMTDSSLMVSSKSVEDTNVKPKPNVDVSNEAKVAKEKVVPLHDSTEKGKVVFSNVKLSNESDIHILNTTTATDIQNHNESYGSPTSIRKLDHLLNLDNGAVKRTFYVVAGLTGIVLLYFMIKGIKLRRKPKITRYGLLAERELECLEDGDDEDEDMTLFDASRHKKKGRGP